MTHAIGNAMTVCARQCGLIGGAKRTQTSAFLAGCLVLASVAHGADTTATSRFASLVKGLSPFVAAGYSHDSNLFRLPDTLPPDLVPQDGRSDQYLTLSGGIDTEFDISKQQLAFAGQVFHNAYSSYDELDYTGGTGLAVWRWAGGSRVKGNLGYQYDKQLRSFVNRNIVTRENARDLRTENAFFADAELKVLQDWRLGVRGDWADIEFSASKLLNLQRFTGGAAISYLSPSQNILGFDAEVITGSYERDSSRDFDEWDIGPTFDWQFGSRTKIRGKIGYTSRDYDSPTRIDFEDFTGRVSLVRKTGRGNSIKATVWREVSNLGDEIATFALIQGISIEPTWKLSTNLALRLLLSYEDRDFDGEDPTLPPSDLADRTDKLYSGIVTADWQFTRALLLSLGFDAQKRTSNRDFRDFEARVVQAQFTFSL